MKAKHLFARLSRAIFGLVLLFSLSWVQPVQGQDGQPPQPDSPDEVQIFNDLYVPDFPDQPGIGRDPASGAYYRVASSEPGGDQPGAVQALNTGGPDNYGYTFRDSRSGESYSWINAASGGTSLGFSNNSYMYYSASLPFSFNYYENTYTQLYISANGFITFSPPRYLSTQDRVPGEDYINNVIAGYWTPVYFASSSRVYRKSGGTAPNRYFVIEWYQLKGGSPSEPVGGNDTFTFEIVLYENGTINLNYQTMSYVSGTPYDYWCGGAGIEDSRGTDGLEFNWCDRIPSNLSVRFTRPAPMGRVLVYPDWLGAFGYPGKAAVFPIPIRNTGTLGSDVFDLTFDGIFCPWEGSFIGLRDTNANGIVDTGPVAQNATVTVDFGLEVPKLGKVGDHQQCGITVIPAKNPAKLVSVTLSAAVPAPFTLISGKGSDPTSLAVVEPAEQKRYTNAAGTSGETPAVSEAPNGNLVSAWTVGRCIQSDCSNYVVELFYSILDKDGGVIKTPTRLTDLTGLSQWSYDSNPSIAVAPDGTIGIAFSRTLYNASSQSNLNIYLARLDSAGNLISPQGMTNLTNNSGFYSSDSSSLIRVQDPAISATSDNRFQVIWQRYQVNSNINDIYLTVFTTQNNQLRAPFKITNDTNSSSDGAYYANLAVSNGDDVVVVYTKYPEIDIFYQVLDSNGDPLVVETNLTNDGTTIRDYDPDVVGLSDGHTLIAWKSSYNDFLYSLLDSNYAISSSTQIINGDWDSANNIALAADRGGRGVITFTDSSYSMIFYSLVNSQGTLLTPPQPYQYSEAGNLISYSSWYLTSRTIQSTTPFEDLFFYPHKDVPIWAGSTKNIQVYFGNLGLATASAFTITLTAPAGLQLGIPDPLTTCILNECTWTFLLADLGFLDGGSVEIPVTMASSVPGTSYTIEFHIDSAGTEPLQENNDLSISLISAYPAMLPMILR